MRKRTFISLEDLFFSCIRLKYHLYLKKNRYLQMNLQEKVDIWSMKLILSDVGPNAGIKAILPFDHGDNQLSGTNHMQDNFAFIKQELYQYSNWGWLSNQYFKLINDLRMPSWQQVQECIIEEEIVMEREKVLQNLVQ